MFRIGDIVRVTCTTSIYVFVTSQMLQCPLYEKAMISSVSHDRTNVKLVFLNPDIQFRCNSGDWSWGNDMLTLCSTSDDVCAGPRIEEVLDDEDLSYEE